jgi:signal transduction histidine kinase
MAPQRPTGLPKLTLQPVDVSLLVMESCELLEAAVAGSTLLDLDLDGNLPLVRADAVQLRRALIGLVCLAADSLAGAPSAICVQTRPYRKGSQPPAVALEVRDTISGARGGRLAACGVSGEGRQQGLPSLAEIRSIVEAHGGRLAHESHPDEGTRVLALFPVAPSR